MSMKNILSFLFLISVNFGTQFLTTSCNAAHISQLMESTNNISTRTALENPIPVTKFKDEYVDYLITEKFYNVRSTHEDRVPVLSRQAMVKLRLACPILYCILRLSITSDKKLTFKQVRDITRRTLVSAGRRPNFARIFSSYKMEIRKISSFEWSVDVPILQISTTQSLAENTRSAQQLTGIFVDRGLRRTGTGDFSKSKTNSAVIVYDEDDLDTHHSSHFSTLSSLDNNHFQTVRNIEKCRYKRCASRVQVWSKHNIKSLIVERAVKKVKQRNGFKQVYDYNKVKYWRTKHSTNRWIVLFPFKRSYQWRIQSNNDY